MDVTQERTKQLLKTVVDYCLLDELNCSSRIMALGACLVALHYKALNEPLFKCYCYDTVGATFNGKIVFAEGP